MTITRKRKKKSSKARAKRLREKLFARAMTVVLKGAGDKADKTLHILGKRVAKLEEKYGLRTALKK